MSNFPKIILKSGRDSSVKRFHPWVFSGGIRDRNNDLKEGDVVEVYSNSMEYLATGHFQIGSIMVRIFSFEKTDAGKDFWKHKFENAYKLRQIENLIENPKTNVYRLIHGEGDGFPGFIVDYYNGTIVMQAHSIGFYLLENLFAEILQEIYLDRVHCIIDKSASTLPFKANLNAVDKILFGKTEGELVKENGSTYFIDVLEGQKTGFFVDQRENRLLLEKYSKDKDVLNVFCYTGGFSVAALKAGATSVHSIDSSQKAMDLTDKNVELNFGKTEKHVSFCEDAFAFLDTIDNKYDVIVLDPPAFAKHNESLDNALKGYRKINRKAIEKIRPNGIIFTFSCSQVVSKEDFRTTVFTAASLAKRQVRILHQLTQPADHPINIYHPEGEYLKGLVLLVE